MKREIIDRYFEVDEDDEEVKELIKKKKIRFAFEERIQVDENGGLSIVH